MQRSQCLPEGGSLSAARAIRASPANCAALSIGSRAQPKSVLAATKPRETLWNDCYPALSQARPGLYGAATSRAEAQVLRLSAIYAALDCSPVIAAASSPGCPRRMGLLLRQRLLPLRHLHWRPHRRPYPRGPRRIPRRLVQGADQVASFTAMSAATASTPHSNNLLRGAGPPGKVRPDEGAPPCSGRPSKIRTRYWSDLSLLPRLSLTFFQTGDKEKELQQSMSGGNMIILCRGAGYAKF